MHLNTSVRQLGHAHVGGTRAEALTWLRPCAQRRGSLAGRGIAVTLGVTSVLALLVLGAAQAKPPQGFIPGADDYVCYKTTGPHVDATVRLSDRFDGFGDVESNQPGDPRVKRIQDTQWYCNPVRKKILTGPHAGFVQPVNHPELHYVCHNINPADVKSPEVTVDVHHEFRDEGLNIEEEAFLCSSTIVMDASPADSLARALAKVGPEVGTIRQEHIPLNCAAFNGLAAPSVVLPGPNGGKCTITSHYSDCKPAVGGGCTCTSTVTSRSGDCG